MNMYISLSTKKKRTKLYCFIFFSVLLSFVFSTFNEELDLLRYYEAAIDDYKEYNNWVTYLKVLIERDFDFIYSLSLYFALQLGLPMNLVSICYVSLYYIAISEVLRRHFPGLKVVWYVFFFVLMCAPFIWVREISRNLAAFSFFYLAIIYYLEHRYKSMLCWIIVSVFTHISMIMYVPLILGAHVFRKFTITNTAITLIIIVMLVISYYMPSYLLDLLALVMDGRGTSRYSLYASLETHGALSSPNIGYGDKFPMAYIYIYSIVLLIRNKDHDFMYWMLLFLTIMLSFFLLSNMMFTNRVIMVMPIFVAWNTYSILRSKKLFDQFIIKKMSVLGILLVLAHLYSYRDTFTIF